MEFKKEYIHCVPDESLIGKYVLCADTYKEIIKEVESNDWKSYLEILVEIDKGDIDADCPFETTDTRSAMDVVHYHTFVYYDPEWDEETVYYCYLDKDGKRSCFSYTSKKPSSHIYAEFTDINLANDWCIAHDKFAEIAKAWEDGKTIQYFAGNWLDCAYNEPCWDLNMEYRVKPDEPVEVETSEGKMYLANGAEIPKKRRMTNRELAKWLVDGNGQKATINGNAVCYHGYDLDDDNKEVEDCMIRGWDETEWHEPEVEVSV